MNATMLCAYDENGGQAVVAVGRGHQVDPGVEILVEPRVRALRDLRH